MKPRKYKYKIEVWRTIAVSDGFGGNVIDDDTPNEELLTDSWCKVSTIPVNKYEDFGLDEVKKAIKVYVRKRNDLDYNRSDLFFKYKGDRYTINSVSEIEMDSGRYEFQIICST